MLKHRVEAVINTENLKHNFKLIRLLAGESRVISVVKADAYGHGAVECARIIEGCGGDMFAVATAEEGMELREGGIRGEILVLGVSVPENIELLYKYNLIQAVDSEEYADVLAEYGKPIRIHIKIDTGMSRLGFYCHGEEDIPDAFCSVMSVATHPSLMIEGIFTHFACSDMPESTMTRRQFGLFKGFCDYCEQNGLDVGIRHCCNSAALVNYPEMRLDAVRTGIILYGLEPDPKLTPCSGLLPCMSLVTRVAQVTKIKKGDTVSYGAAFMAERDMTLATVSIGYADGLLRRLSGRADVLIRGRRAPLVGRICMDMCIADVSNIECKPGDEVVIFGEGQSANELAALAGTINYEIICNAAGKRTVRRYI